jgi:hypothetical protein
MINTDQSLIGATISNKLNPNTSILPNCNCCKCQCCCNHDYEKSFCGCKQCKKCSNKVYGSSCGNYWTNTWTYPLSQQLNSSNAQCTMPTHTINSANKL